MARPQQNWGQLTLLTRWASIWIEVSSLCWLGEPVFELCQILLHPNLSLPVEGPFTTVASKHGDVIEWKDFPRYWPFVRGIHLSPVNSPHKGQWHGALMFSLICAGIKGWVNNGEAGDLRCHRTHYDVTIMHYRPISQMFITYCMNIKLYIF